MPHLPICTVWAKKNYRLIFFLVECVEFSVAAIITAGERMHLSAKNSRVVIEDAIGLVFCDTVHYGDDVSQIHCDHGSLGML